MFRLPNMATDPLPGFWSHQLAILATAQKTRVVGFDYQIPIFRHSKVGFS